jgi:hypothetical protein
MSAVLRRSRLPVVLALAVAALAGSGCGDSPSEEVGGGEQAKVAPVKGTDLRSVTLTAQAAKRLGIETAAVRRRGARRSVVPYDAVLYSADGATFTYTSPKPRVYVRAPITVVRIDDDTAVLSSGPPVGTEVVTVGSQELYGSEYEVEED